MTSDLPPPISFDDLRAEAIPAAQHASGQIWTDFNIHDPGVTLLEQTCFALTEIAYRSDHAVRDLLTLPDGGFDAEALALFGPEQTLPGRPVTALDMAAGLSALDTVERVFVHPAAAPGLFDIAFVPRPGIPEHEAISALADAVAQVRLIGTDVGRIETAQLRELDLSGRVGISAFAKPETIAAQIYHRINLALHGLGGPSTGGRSGATRDDVFDEPATIWPPVSAEPGNPSRIDLTLSELEQIDGVESVHDLVLRFSDTGAIVPRNPRKGVVYDVRLPTNANDIPLTLTLNDNPAPLHPGAIAEEYDRMVAARIARQGNRLDPHDFDVLTPGRPRRPPAGVDVDATLPAIYRYRGLDQARTYRKTINAHLGDVTASLADLPHRYATRRPVDWSHPADIRRHIEMLNYLIALQGEDMPETSQSGINLYRGPAAHSRWSVEWRESYLEKLPQLNYYQGTAHPEFGVEARLAHLTDLSRGIVGDEDAALTDNHLVLDPATEPPEPTVDRRALLLPYRPTDMLLQRDTGAAPLAEAARRRASPWLNDTAIHPELFRRATDPDAYFLARDRNSDWQLLFEPYENADMLYACATGRDRAEMEKLGNRLCNSWQALNRDRETVTLVEDIRLRNGTTSFRHSSATALLTGWTARTARPAFRRYVEDIILRVAPAHVLVRPVWLSQEGMQGLLPLLRAWHADKEGAGGALREALAALPDESAQ